MGSPPLVSFHAFCIFCSAILLKMLILMLVAQVPMVVAMPMLAFVKWFRGNRQPGLWMGMMSKSFNASNT
jgi:hypothetical protein